MTQRNLNDIVRNSNLSKKLVQIFGYSLKDCNLLSPDMKISYFRHRSDEWKPYFSKADDDVIYCNDIQAVMNFECNSTHWLLFIDPSTTSLKAMLHINGNKRPSKGRPIEHEIPSQTI